MLSTACTSASNEDETEQRIFQRMIAIQEKITQIEHRLKWLRMTEGDTEMQEVNESSESGDAIVASMLSAELCQLAALGDAVGVRILLNCGVNCDCRDYDQRTPLHVASSQGHVEVVTLLLEFGADHTLTDKDGKTALRLATERNCHDVVQLLTLYRTRPQDVQCLSTNMNSIESDCADMLCHPDLSVIPQPMMGGLIVVIMGLSGRGKSFIAGQIKRYFQWNGLSSKIFDRDLYQEKLTSVCDHYEKMNPVDVEHRVATSIAHDITRYVIEFHGVAIVDGLNCTVDLRMGLMRAISETGLIRPNRVVFVEVVTNDPEKVRRNIQHLQEMLADYSESFVETYYAKIRPQMEVYASLNPITDKDLTYIRIEDQLNFSLNKISGWMPSRLAYMLHNLCHSPGNLYLTCSGEYEDFIVGRIGGDSHLTRRGQGYSQALFEYFQRELQMNPFTVLSSCAKRCTETVQYFEEQSALLHDPSAEGKNVPLMLNCRVSYLPTLDDVNHGDCDGQLFSDVQKTMPSTVHQMEEDPYHTAWPNGECMHQVFNARLEPHIHDIQASSVPVLVVSHIPLLQGLYSYFVSENGSFISPQDAYKIVIPSECVIKIRLVGVDRVAEVVDLSNEVSHILQSNMS